MPQMKHILFAILFTMTSAVKSEVIPFPQTDISSLLIMNSAEMGQFIKSKNIDIFKFVDPFPSLSKDIPHDFIASLAFVDRSRFEQYSDLFNGDILGIYFSHYNPTVNIERDTVLLSDKADRWTIAHEMAHALIDQKRPTNQKKNEHEDLERLINAKEDYEESMSLYHNFGGFPSDGHMRRAFDSIKVWTTTIVEFMYTYELEEVRIERYLESLYETKPELKLDAYTYQRSFWYSKKNCTQAINKFNNAKEVVDYFSTIISDKHKVLMKNEIDEQKTLMEIHGKFIADLCL